MAFVCVKRVGEKDYLTLFYADKEVRYGLGHTAAVLWSITRMLP